MFSLPPPHHLITLTAIDSLGAASISVSYSFALFTSMFVNVDHHHHHHLRQSVFASLPLSFTLPHTTSMSSVTSNTLETCDIIGIVHILFILI